MSRGYLINQMVGEYRVVDFLGAGGMGEVYRAEHSKIGRLAAVKVLTQATATSGFVERFFNEARIQASLQHPNIATLYDFLEVSGQPCIIMEYVDGETLSDRVASYGALPLSETVFIFQAVVEAVAYIHGHGIIHRDIKSNNIKLSRSGQVKLLDFGIAKGQTSSNLTATGSIIGTLQYLAPENIHGGTGDARGDIWALGVLLYEMATGRMPFESEAIAVLCEKINKAEYAPPAQLHSGVPREVSAIVARCLKKNPAERYQTADELLRDARALSTLVSTPGFSDLAGNVDAGRPTRSKGALAVVGVAAGCVLLVAIVLGSYMAFNSSNGGETTSAVAQTSEAANVSAVKGAAPSASKGAQGVEKSIELNLTEGRADIYRDGARLGTTPYKLSARVGERVRLTLKREGFKDEAVDFTVSESRREYAFTMER